MAQAQPSNATTIAYRKDTLYLQDAHIRRSRYAIIIAGSVYRQPVLHRRGYNPLLIAAGFDKTEAAIPWLKKKRLRFVFG